METSTGGDGHKTASFDLSAWYNADTGHIHLAMPRSDWFITTVSNDPKSRRYHPNLFRKLARALKEKGVPYPSGVMSEASTGDDDDDGSGT